MKILHVGFVLFASIGLSACSSAPVNNDRTEALALAAENSAGVLMIASLPLQYYCSHNAWPTKFEPSLQNKKLASSISHLHYARDQKDYVADFKLRSFVPDDPFVVDWHMILTSPALNFTEPQTVAITLESDQYSIFIPFDYQFVCTDAKLMT